MALVKWIPLVLLQLAVIVGIVLLIRHYLINNVTRVTSRLDRMGEDFTKKQEEAARHLQKARQDADQTLANAQQEAEKIKEKAAGQVEMEREELLKKARLQGEQIVDEATRTKEYLMSEMDKKIREGAIEIAAEMVPQILSDRVRLDAHAHRISELINGGLQGFEGVNVPAGTEVRVTSAFQLTEEQRGGLLGTLHEKFGADAQIREETDSGLIAGAVVGVGDLVVDASLKYSIEEATRNVRRSAGG